MQQFPFGAWPSGVLPGNGPEPQFEATAAGVTNAPLQNPSTSASGIREQCSALLVRAHDWLERAVAQAPEVNGLVPLVTQAVSLYSRGEYMQCLRLATGVQQAIALARTSMSSLPAW
ncbi:hypothetical protein [Streptomyces soliscabiei]|uniref:hypothetical protein n=1 Tax=Streptomyces soliscabiei TaxID=588897 RepID=UPI0029BA8DDE|nr:hypothetical protein [Streptomyces sp. NY05-11A]MDX2679941.1 hypothetical protein [Streptomyces sp. NY05-11A]